MSEVPAVRPGESAAEVDGQLKRWGIARVPADHFEYGGYRYTNLNDAVAEAKRRAPGDGAR